MAFKTVGYLTWHHTESMERGEFQRNPITAADIAAGYRQTRLYAKVKSDK